MTANSTAIRPNATNSCLGFPSSLPEELATADCDCSTAECFDAEPSDVPEAVAEAWTSAARGVRVVTCSPFRVFVTASVVAPLAATHDAPSGSESAMPGVSVR